MYKIINEDGSLVRGYPSDALYDLLTDKEKEHIQLFKNEVEKITEKEGLGKITVSVSYDEPIIEKAFQIQDKNGYSFDEFQEILDKIRLHMADFCKNNKELCEFKKFS